MTWFLKRKPAFADGVLPQMPVILSLILFNWPPSSDLKRLLPAEWSG